MKFEESSSIEENLHDKDRLFDVFNQFLSNKPKWDYYGKMYGNYNLQMIFENPGEFIIKYLHNGEKTPEKELKDFFKDPEFKKRVSHTVSIFFLGLSLYYKLPIIRKEIDKYLKELKKKVHDCDPSDSPIDLPFSYYWFLICFYHDLGYFVMSKRNGEFKLFNGKKDWDNVEKTIIEKIGQIQSLGIKISPIIKNSCINYLKYRRKHPSKFGPIENIDHGFISGISFYFQRETKFQEFSELFPDQDHFVHKGLHWSKHLLEQVHSSISWNIISHNVWYLPKNIPESNIELFKTKNLYVKYELNDLILKTDEPPVKISDFPMYFLICLVDTIDPVKMFINWDSVTVEKETLDILRDIEFEKNKPSSFHFKFNGRLDSNHFYSELKKNEYWLGMKVDELDNNTIKVTISS
jgi:hypothetical protein